MKDENQPARVNGQQPLRQPIGHEALLEAISREQALLARLDREQADAQRRLAERKASWRHSATNPRPMFVSR